MFMTLVIKKNLALNPNMENNMNYQRQAMRTVVILPMTKIEKFGMENLIVLFE